MVNSTAQLALTPLLHTPENNFSPRCAGTFPPAWCHARLADIILLTSTLASQRRSGSHVQPPPLSTPTSAGLSAGWAPNSAKDNPLETPSWCPLMPSTRD